MPILLSEGIALVKQNVFLKYNVFNAFDAVPYFLLPDHATERLEQIMDSMKTESVNALLFAHRDYQKYLVKLFLIEIQRIGQRGTGHHCVSIMQQTACSYAFARHWSIIIDRCTR